MRAWMLLLPLFVNACTAGAPAAGSGAAPPAGSENAGLTTINISLTTSTVVSTAYGSSGGFTPAVVTLPVGASLRFVNVDSFAHTSSAFGGTAFPAASPLGSAALTASGSRLSSGWSSGSLAAGAASQTLLADQAGTYLFGCFFHYGAPMRAAIVVR